MAYKNFTQPNPDYKDRDELVNTFENIHFYEQISVWQKAFNLLLRVYKVTRKFPKEERFGMVSDMTCKTNNHVIIAFFTLMGWLYPKNKKWLFSNVGELLIPCTFPSPSPSPPHAVAASVGQSLWRRTKLSASAESSVPINWDFGRRWKLLCGPRAA